MSGGIRQLAGIFLALVFFQQRKVKKNEIYLRTTLSCACSDDDGVGSGSGSRCRAGACICSSRIWLEGSKSKDKSLPEFQLSLAG